MTQSQLQEESAPPLTPAQSRNHVALAILLVVGGGLGLLASFALTMDDITLLRTPGSALTCNVNAILNCGKNIASPQGSTFGFPNPVLGLMMYPAPVIVGFALLARARFAGWFWWVFDAGLLFATVFIFWLAYQSVFVIGTLCPWCSLVYVVTIPMFLAVTVRNLRAGLAGSALTRVGDALAWWVPLLSLLGYVIIFGAAQLHLNILGSLL